MDTVRATTASTGWTCPRCGGADRAGSSAGLPLCSACVARLGSAERAVLEKTRRDWDRRWLFSRRMALALMVPALAAAAVGLARQHVGIGVMAVRGAIVAVLLLVGSLAMSAPGPIFVRRSGPRFAVVARALGLVPFLPEGPVRRLFDAPMAAGLHAGRPVAIWLRRVRRDRSPFHTATHAAVETAAPGPLDVRVPPPRGASATKSNAPDLARLVMTDDLEARFRRTCASDPDFGFQLLDGRLVTALFGFPETAEPLQRRLDFLCEVAHAADRLRGSDDPGLALNRRTAWLWRPVFRWVRGDV